MDEDVKAEVEKFPTGRGSIALQRLAGRPATARQAAGYGRSI
jgi:hypothetical protein